jgi:hypothetical protein
LISTIALTFTFSSNARCAASSAGHPSDIPCRNKISPPGHCHTAVHPIGVRLQPTSASPCPRIAVAQQIIHGMAMVRLPVADQQDGDLAGS